MNFIRRLRSKLSYLIEWYDREAISLQLKHLIIKYNDAIAFSLVLVAVIEALFILVSGWQNKTLQPLSIRIT